MDEHTLELLEFTKILAELAEYCVSPQGAALICTQPHLTSPEPLNEALALALEFRAILESGKPLPGFDFPDIEGALPKLGKEGLQLEGEELAGIGRWVLSALKMKRVILIAGASGRLASIASRIPDLTLLSRRIFRIVDQEGLLREKQIPELAVIRERIRRHREDADRAVRGLLEQHAYRTYWQTTTPTQRDGRVVLPLKAQYKGRVKGIVHEMSSSGSTLFIEPLEVVEKNNAIVQQENLYRLQARKILRELTAEVSARAVEISLLVETVALLDTILARARYAVLHSCNRAEIPPGAGGGVGTISLREARHPLLGSVKSAEYPAAVPGGFGGAKSAEYRGEVVPVTVTTGSDHRVLIITGPNTGGKTVSLKTVGLLALMNQFAMEIPAAEGSQLPVFDSIFADIGDEQSIEQSLSTFSGHVKNLSGIVSRATARSLVLLDELGAGTDPQEGVALAMALLDHFLATGCIVMATTHHGILKNYGATRPGAQNASMGFDRETLAPTYRILMGVPGESHALEIARRTGMPHNVLAIASSYLDDERTDISRLVSNLAERHQRLAEEEEAHMGREHELREKRRVTDQKELTLRQKELELRRHGLKELRDFLGQARKEWEALREKSGSNESAPGARRNESAPGARRVGGADFGLFAAGVQERIEGEEESIMRDRESLAPPASFEIHDGMEVTIIRTGRRGRVMRRDKGPRWIVETETMRLSLLPGELRPAVDPTPPSAAPIAVSYLPTAPLAPPVLELRLLGMRLEEAMRLVEKQIDSALIHGLREFSIVHGKGEGILRTAIHEYLRGLSVVQDFRFSAPEEGGFGKTIVTLKS